MAVPGSRRDPTSDPPDPDEDRQQTGVGVSGSGGGPGSWGPGGWGPGGFGGPGGHGGRGRRDDSVPDDLTPTPPEGAGERLRGAATGGRRDLLAAVLLLLDEWAMRESQLSREIAERSGCAWQVSASDVAHALDSLRLAGMVGTVEVEGHEVAHLTQPGKDYVERNRGELGSPWDDVEGAADAARGSTGGSRGRRPSRHSPGPPAAETPGLG